MKTEYEAKFLDVNIEKMRQTLKKVGAKLEKPMRSFRRVTIDTPEMTKKGAYLRVRDEGDRITLTYKQFKALSVDGAREYEIIVDDFEETIALLTVIGYPAHSYQESKRETWRSGNVEIVIDEWPWLKPYIEIEADGVEPVKTFAKKLGLDWDDAVFGDVMTAYRAQYPHLTMKDTIGNLPEVRFGDPLPDLLKSPKKN